jgi:hypothetical protein
MPVPNAAAIIANVADRNGVFNSNPSDDDYRLINSFFYGDKLLLLNKDAFCML